MKRLIVPCIISILLLTCVGCSFQRQLETEGAAAADDVLATTEWALCNAQTIGAVARTYGLHPDVMQAYNVLCAKYRPPVDLTTQ